MISTAVDIEGISVNVMVMDLELGIEETVHDNSDGSYTVILNSRYTNARMMRAFDHAVEHIRNNDFGKANVQTIEAQAHGIQVDEKPDWRKHYEEVIRPQIEKRIKSYRRQLKAYERKYSKMSIWEIEQENEKTIRRWEAHMADPDYRF